MRFSALFFDVGNTLVRMDYRFLAETLESLAVRTTPGEVEMAECRARAEVDTLVALGLSTESEEVRRRYFSEIFTSCGGEGDAAFADFFNRVWDRSTEGGLFVSVPNGVFRALNLLAATKRPLGVISNSDGTVRALLERLDLAHRFDFIVDSGVVGFEKPDPRIFEMACRLAGVPPAQASYIGDLPSVDHRGASEAGLDASILDPAGVWKGKRLRTFRTLEQYAEWVVTGE